jgi:prepilin-type N-terminal cleavage/methylation domain-containing protein
MRRSGMTLVELVVVLVILAVLTTIAISMTDNVLDQSRFDATRTTLDNMRTAIVGSGNPQDLSGSFVSDLGTLPSQWTDLTSLTTPAAYPVYSNYTTFSTSGTAVPQTPPAGMNSVNWMAGNANETEAFKALSSIPITLSAGWRGPYLRLPPNGTLTDGWGNPFAAPVVAAGALTISSPGKPIDVDSPAGSPFSSQLAIAIPTPNLFTSSITVTLANYDPTVQANVVLLTNVNGVVNAVSAKGLDAIAAASKITLAVPYTPQVSNGYMMTFSTASTSSSVALPIPSGTRAIVAYQVPSTGSTKYSPVTYLKISGGSYPITLNLQ